MLEELRGFQSPFTQEESELPEERLPPSQPPQKPGKHRLKEHSDDYPNVVMSLDERWRVIVCRNGIQWILQYRKSLTKPDLWEGRSYCQTREGLERAIKEKIGRTILEEENADMSKFQEHILEK